MKIINKELFMRYALNSFLGMNIQEHSIQDNFIRPIIQLFEAQAWSDKPRTAVTDVNKHWLEGSIQEDLENKIKSIRAVKYPTFNSLLGTKITIHQRQLYHIKRIV